MNYHLSPRTLFLTLALGLALAFLSDTTAAHAAETPATDPAAAGMSKQGLAQIRPTLQSFVDQNLLAGAVTLVARHGHVASIDAVGYADLDAKRPMTPQTLFRIASMTKAITALGIMILRDEGKLSINDPVSKYIPAFKDIKTREGEPRGDVITLWHLLTHTSGISGRADANLPSLEEYVNAVAAQPIGFEPGSRWSYSNTGIATLGRIIEVASGTPYDQFLRQRIFDPLAMSDTTFRPNEEQLSRLALVYQPGDNDGPVQRSPLNDNKPIWLTESFPHPAGGLYSTAPDLARLYQMMLNDGQLNGKRIVSTESMRMMRNRQTREITTGFAPGMGWGLGAMVVRQPQGINSMFSTQTFGHGGAYATQGWMDPAKDMFVIYLVARNGFPLNGDSSPLLGEFQQTAVSAIAD